MNQQAEGLFEVTSVPGRMGIHSVFRITVSVMTQWIISRLYGTAPSGNMRQSM